MSFEEAPMNLMLFSSRTLAKVAFSDKNHIQDEQLQLLSALLLT